MSGKTFAAISDHAILPERALDFIADPAHGAVDVFMGQVRGQNLGRQVRGVSYDVFEPLALNVFQSMCAEARERWGESLNIYLEHFRGRLEIGGISVIIAVSSPHRDEAFRACRYLIEELKNRAPIWKQEHYVDGDSEWLQGHALCSHHAE